MIETSSTGLDQQVKSKFNSDFLRAIFFTLLLVSIYRLGIQIPIPFLNEDAFKEYFGVYHYFNNSSSGRFSIFSLGIMPYVSAYVLVEILSLFIAPLKRLRKGDFKGRCKLKQIALTFTMFLCILQAAGIINGLKKMELPSGLKLLEIGHGYEYVLLVAILVGGVYLLITICELISKFGIGHGISLILLSGICAQFYSDFNRHLSISKELDSKVYIFPLCVFFLFVYLMVILLKSKALVGVSYKRQDNPDYLFQFNFCPSAKIPLIYASSMVMIPATITNFFGIGKKFENWFSPGSFIYEINIIIFVFLFSYLFAWLFFHPKRRIKKLEVRGWEFRNNGISSEKYLLNKLFIYNLPWTVFLCLLAIVPHILICSFNVPFYIGGASVALVAAISLDVLDRYNFVKTKNQKPIKIAEFHDIYDATMIKNHLNAQGILCHLQGYYHRHLLYFFGPYIDISIMVSGQDQTAAEKLIKNYHNGLGLLIKT